MSGDTFERLEAVLVRDYKAAPGSLTPDARLDALGIDSLGTVELLWSIEETFNVKLPPDPVALETVGDVVRYLDGLMAGTPALHTAAPGLQTPAAAPDALPTQAAASGTTLPRAAP